MGKTNSSLPEFVREAFEDQDLSQKDCTELQDALALVGALVEPAEDVSATGRARLLAEVSSPPEKYAPFLDRLAAMFDLKMDAMKTVLTDSLDPSRWEPGPVPVISLFHFDSGPRVAEADTGLVRIPAGFPFPTHKHLGDELVFVLEGSYRDDDGVLHEPGDSFPMPAGSSHRYDVLPYQDLLTAVVLFGGLEIEGL